MKFKFLKAALASLIMSVSLLANAGLMHNGYEVGNDGTYDTVFGNGEEFLNLDNTLGMSIDDALSTFGNQGWVLASTDQGSDLIQNFLGAIDWDKNEETHQFATQIGLDSNYDKGISKFFSMFGGNTLNNFIAGPYYDSTSYVYSDNSNILNALYGSDSNGNGLYERIQLRDASRYKSCSHSNFYGRRCGEYRETDARADLFSDSGWQSNQSHNKFAVLLTRSHTFTKDAKQVPEPSALAIFALGMVGLASRRFKKQS